MARVKACALMLSSLAVVSGAPASGPGAPSAGPGASLPAAPTAVATDTWDRTSSGSRHLVPAGWRSAVVGGATVLTKPGEDATVVLVEPSATTADDAVARAWAQFRPDDAPELRGADERPPRHGWTSIRAYTYRARGEPDRVVRAHVLHDGAAWIVVILDVAAPVMERRAPQVTRILSSLRAADYAPESLQGRASRPLDAARVDSLRRFLEDARALLGIPGIGLGLVQDGRVRHAGGLGVRRAGGDEPVDASTLFLTASVTKPLTSLLLARLVDDGRMDWDTPVVALHPSFAVADAGLTRRVQVRHLLCACTGIPARDAEWIFSGEDLTPADTFRILAGVEPTAGIGELYQYSNLMAAAGGFVAGHAAYPRRDLGDAYDRAMQRLVFDPLQMRSTTFDASRAQRGNHAAPHGTTLDGRTVVAAMDFNLVAHPMRPDGGAWSNVDDLLRYLRLELAGGVLPDGRRYVREPTLAERRAPQVARGGIDQWYGMGLKTDRTQGVEIVSHGGSMAGYQAEVLWIPDAGAGYVLLMNADAGADLRPLFHDRFLEALYGVDKDTDARLRKIARLLREEREAERPAMQAPPPAYAVRNLAPLYVHPSLGRIRVATSDTATVFDFGGWRTEVALRTTEDARVAFESISPSVAGYRFTVSAVDDRPALILEGDSSQYVFTAVRPPSEAAATR